MTSVRVASSREPELPTVDPFGEPERELDLRQYGQLLLRSWKLIVLCASLGLVAGLARSFMQAPLYSSRAVLNVERDKIVPSDVGLGPAFFEQYNAEFLPTQLELVRSRDIVMMAVKRLKLVDAARPVGLSDQAADQAAEEAALGTVTAIQGGLRVSQRGTTSLVEITYVDTDARRAADIVNGVSDAYIDWVLESKVQVVGQASQFLTAQIEQIKDDIQEKERQILSFSRSSDVLSLGPESVSGSTPLDGLSKDLVAAMSDRVGKEARYHESQAASPETIAVQASAQVGTLTQELARLERDYQQRLHLFKPDWPAMLELNEQITRMREQLNKATSEAVARAREAAKTEYLTAVQREEALKRLMGAQRAKAMNLNGNTVEYTNLRVELAAKRSLMDTLLRRQSETEVRSRLTGVRQGNIRVVERAIPARAPFAPSHQRSGQMGLGAGLAVGFFLAYLRTFLDRSIKSTGDVQAYLRLPALGIVPALGNATARRYGYGLKVTKETPPEQPLRPETHAHDHPRSTGAEAYRAIRSSLLHSRAGGVKSFVVASSVPGEGKTCTATNLAIVLAQLGKKALVVDADLHKPRLHEVMGLSNRVGLVSVLAEGLDAREAIVETAFPGVWFLPSGPSTPNPSGLLASEAMGRFLQGQEERFDYVIFDSPPTLLVSDALILSGITDGVVLCVKGGTTPREQVGRVKERLHQNRVTILGVLVNNLKEEALGYGYGYGGSYYYKGYGYGYGLADAYGESRNGGKEGDEPPAPGQGVDRRDRRNAG